MQLKPLYTVRFFYPKGWEIELKGERGTEEHDFFFAEGTVEGGIRGSFRAANHPRRRTDGPFRMDMQGFIEAEDGALLMVDYQGYGRSYPPGRRQVVGAAFHLSDDERYKWLNDSVCAIAGEVRLPVPPPAALEQKDVQLVFSVAELVWEPPS